MTRELLAFSRKQVVQPVVLDLNEVVRETEGLLRRLIGADTMLVLQLGEDVKSVKADRSQIEQVLLNLAANARDAMPDGGTLTIRTDNATSDETGWRHDVTLAGPHVILAVSDTGHGMTSEVRSHIFEPFYTTKEQGKGTGLGLATVYGIVTQAGGQHHRRQRARATVRRSSSACPRSKRRLRRPFVPPTRATARSMAARPSCSSKTTSRCATSPVRR